MTGCCGVIQEVEHGAKNKRGGRPALSVCFRIGHKAGLCWACFEFGVSFFIFHIRLRILRFYFLSHRAGLGGGSSLRHDASFGATTASIVSRTPCHALLA